MKHLPERFLPPNGLSCGLKCKSKRKIKIPLSFFFLVWGGGFPKTRRTHTLCSQTWLMSCLLELIHRLDMFSFAARDELGTEAREAQSVLEVSPSFADDVDPGLINPGVTDSFWKGALC